MKRNQKGFTIAAILVFTAVASWMSFEAGQLTPPTKAKAEVTPPAQVAQQ